jgi:hypothetical protein
MNSASLLESLDQIGDQGGRKFPGGAGAVCLLDEANEWRQSCDQLRTATVEDLYQPSMRRTTHLPVHGMPLCTIL